MSNTALKEITKTLNRLEDLITKKSYSGIHRLYLKLATASVFLYI